MTKDGHKVRNVQLKRTATGEHFLRTFRRDCWNELLQERIPEVEEK